MNEQYPSDLIDADELRAAMQPWRPDPDLFANGVRQRIEQAEVLLPSKPDADSTTLDQSEWLQTAAAVIPLPLLGKAASGSLVKLGQLSLGKKLVAWAALPAVGLLLMVVASIYAILKIRNAQRGQPVDGVDVTRLNEVLASWWQRFGLLIAIVSGATLLLMLTGHAMPVFIIFLLSGTAMVGLVSRLGKAGLVDRRTLVGALCPGLLILVQMTHMTTMFSHGYPFLDQMLIPAILVVGALVMTIACEWPSTKPRTSPSSWVVCVGLVLMAGWFSSSLWNPVSTRDLKAYVEGFDHAKFSSASWQQWQVPALWLRESKIPVDLSKPRGLVQAELAMDNPNPWILCYAIEADLIDAADLDRVRNLDGMKKLTMDDIHRGRTFTSIGYHERFLIHALVLRDELSDSDRDFLAERLVATMESLKTKSFGRLLEDQLAITQLAALIERPIDVDLFRDFVHESLVSHQCLGSRLGSQSGGFTMSLKLNFGDEYATAAAIELMQIYGVPEAMHIDALRSYLRPSSNDKWFGLHGPAYVRAASRLRLQSLPGVQSASWLDYFRYEQNLIMAILFTSVCIMATLSAKVEP